MPDMSQAPHEVTLSGKKYSMRPLAEEDYDELDNWFRSTMIEMARKSLTKDMTDEEREEVLGAAMREAHKTSIISKGRVGGKLGLDRVARMIWQGMRQDHPALKFPEVVKAIKDRPEDVMPVMLVFAEINGMEVKVPDAGAEGGPQLPKLSA